MGKYYKKRIDIDAQEITKPLKEMYDNLEMENWLMKAYYERDIEELSNGLMRVNTLEGSMGFEIGDYIIRGIEGELYPCKGHIFKNTYVPVIHPKVNIKTNDIGNGINCLKEEKINNNESTLNCKKNKRVDIDKFVDDIFNNILYGSQYKQRPLIRKMNSNNW